MPVTKQAAKKLRHDRRVTRKTQAVRKNLGRLVKLVRKSPTPKKLASAFSALDKAAKRHLIHPNKAARLKSRLAKLLKKK